jgi:hypothetical protein
MSNGLREDINGADIQGFAPSQIVEITADAKWTPEETDRAFRVGVSGNYFIDDVSAREATLVAGSITVISRRGIGFTFDTTQEIEVM